MSVEMGLLKNVVATGSVRWSGPEDSTTWARLSSLLATSLPRFTSPCGG